jgi:hypothetical protein
MKKNPCRRILVVRGFTLPEFVVAGGLFLFMLGLTAILLRGMRPQEEHLAHFHEFQMATGILFERIKQDVRSARKVAVLPDRIDLLRLVEGPDAGEFSTEEVAYFAAGRSVAEQRSGRVRQHPFVDRLGPRATLRLAFSFSGRTIDMGSTRGVLHCDLVACDERGQPIAGLVASLSVRIQAEEVTP